ncbi:DUF2892 domain-containing protein [Salibacter sp.]|uniref:YgaP family membrane protein n=1 Tax=Salibacter sp. TaxID=2010995 RepID=UPI00287080F7|nr:DUF2892 domain-containing protein [Salibacter sp.]MDR9398062.1 DUF2892 domain-containing protein [Salibacter sp.]MDR9488533.1 DUF2892 domain-containing protein [Salibacter sp.]
MKKNMGSFDTVVRLVLAAVFLFVYFAQDLPGVEGVIMLVLAAAFIITSVFGFCGLYTIFGINTCPMKKS